MGALPDLPPALLKEWTLPEYMKLARDGYFQDQRVELIDGRIVLMCSQDYAHGFAHDNIAEFLREKFGKGFWVRQQMQLNLSLRSAPEPDISVVSGSRVDYKDHPTTALLVIEISNTTLNFDRAAKAALYAQFAIPDYWIVNFPEWRVDVLRDPCKAPDGQYYFSSVQAFHVGQFVSPLCKPELKIAVSDMLPPKDLIR